MLVNIAHVWEWLSANSSLGQLIGLLVLGMVAYSIYRLHSNPHCEINLADLIMDRQSKKIDGARFRINLAFFVTTWVLIYTTLTGHLADWLFAGYLAAWVADRKFSRDNTNTTPPPSQ